MIITNEHLQAFLQEIKEHDNIVIYRHVRPDPDAIGSQLGLKFLLQHAFPEKKVLASGTISSGLAWMGTMDKVTKEFVQNSLVIICDTANQERIDGNYYQEGKKIIKIDHHPLVEDFGDLQIIYPELSSVSELISLMAQGLEKDLPMTDQAAQLLYAGIVGDTGRFMFNSTSSTTFAMASWLTQYNFSAFEINDQFQLMTLEQAKFQAYIYDQLTITENGLAFVKISIETRKKYQLSEEDTNAFVNLPSVIKGLVTWVMFVEQETSSNFWRCRIRSKGPFINKIAEKHGGGGHPMASGANAYSQEEIEEIIQELDQVSANYQMSQIK